MAYTKCIALTWQIKRLAFLVERIVYLIQITVIAQ